MKLVKIMSVVCRAVIKHAILKYIYYVHIFFYHVLFNSFDVFSIFYSVERSRHVQTSDQYRINIRLNLTLMHLHCLDTVLDCLKLKCIEHTD